MDYIYHFFAMHALFASIAVKKNNHNLVDLTKIWAAAQERVVAERRRAVRQDRLRQAARSSSKQTAKAKRRRNASLF